MTAEEHIDHVHAVMNLAGLYGYEIRHWDHAGSVYLMKTGELGPPPDWIGKVAWSLDTWIQRLKDNQPARGVR